MGAVPIVWATGWIAEQMAALGLERFVLQPGDIDGLVTAITKVLDLPDAEFELLSAQVHAGFATHRACSAGQVDQLAAGPP
jgi:hypothetical protein